MTECYRVSGSAAVKGHKYVFDVCTKDRKYHLAADTPSEKHEWIQTLNEVLFSTSVVPPQVTGTVSLANVFKFKLPTVRARVDFLSNLKG